MKKARKKKTRSDGTKHVESHPNESGEKHTTAKPKKKPKKKK